MGRRGGMGRDESGGGGGCGVVMLMMCVFLFLSLVRVKEVIPPILWLLAFTARKGYMIFW